jgi:hypothetical protein
MVVSPFNFGNLRNKVPLATQGFITEWTVAGDATERTITLPLDYWSYHNFTVDWGDGHTSTVTLSTDPNRIHTYASNGVYQVEIRGRCEGWRQGGYPTYINDARKITKVISWGNKLGFQGFKYLSNGFSGCINLTSLPSGGILFSTNTQDSDAPSLYAVFSGCIGLTSLPSDLFKNFTTITKFHETFSSCKNLTSLPSDLFRYNTSVLWFERTFSGCTGLTSLPSDLFRYNILTYEFGSTFYYCTGLTSLPSDLFRYNIAMGYNEYGISGYGFTYTFYGCSGLTSIPSDLFRYNIGLNDGAFARTFQLCTGLTSIPAHLFDYNVSVGVRAFYATFAECTNLVTIPEGLFRYNTSVSTDGFMQTFNACNKLKLNKWIFYSMGEEYQRFQYQVPGFFNCFYRLSYSGNAGTAPTLWLYINPSNHVGCFGGGGNGLAGLTNANDIPSDWK